jgi:mutator protein MutT
MPPILTLSRAVNVCAAAIIVRDKQVLLVQEQKGQIAGRWNMPGGKVESEETATEAIVREVWEETGYRVQPFAIGEVQYLPWPDRPGVTICFVYWCIVAEEPRVNEEGNHPFPTRWVTREELVDLVNQGVFRNESAVKVVELALRGQRFPLEVIREAPHPGIPRYSGKRRQPQNRQRPR